MKLLFSLLLIAPAVAFVPATFGRPAFTLAAAPASAVEAALAASKKFGATSSEARVAWDAVEEMDADNSSTSYGSLDNECLTEEEASNACKDYSEKLNSLETLLAEYAPKLAAMKSITDEMANIKLVVTKSTPGNDSPEQRAALENAKAMSAEFGATSPQAKLAWEDLEEIASSGLSNSMGTRLDEECLVESAKEACMALEELDRVMGLQKSRAENLASY